MSIKWNGAERNCRGIHLRRTDFLDDPINTNGVDLTSLDNLEATVAIVVVVRGPTQRRTDTSMDVRVVLQQALLCRVVEVSAVVDAGDLRGRATKHLGAPGVEVGVEVDDRNGPVGPVDRPQQGQRDGVVSAERDDPGQGLALLRRAELVGVGGWLAGQDAVVTLLDLVKSPCVIVPRAQVCQHVRVKVCWDEDTTHEVTGISPQSSTEAQLLNGFVSRGTLYPPLKPTLVRYKNCYGIILA